MKIILSVIVCVVGSVMLVGGVMFAKAARDYYKLDFDNYTIHSLELQEDDSLAIRDAHDGARIIFPRFVDMIYSWFDYDIRLMDCYMEVQAPCQEYAMGIARKYGNNADLTFTVENTGKLLTIKFTGTAYPENGESVDLSRTYIFDIDGANVNKLPRLVNRADFIGY